MPRAGLGFATEVLYDTGAATSDLTWTLLDHGNVQIGAGTIPAPSGTLSSTIYIAGSLNAVPAGAYFQRRTILWSYSNGTGLTNGEEEYLVEAPLPIAGSRSGVRRKLGLLDEQLEDEEIDLIGAYSDLVAICDQGQVVLLAADPGRIGLLLRDALEALAALRLVPSLQLRVAQREMSSTNQFERAKVDYDELRIRLNTMVEAARIATLALPYAGAAPAFVLSSPTDQFPGA